MPWETMIVEYVRGLDDKKLGELLEQFLPELTEAQYRTVARVVRDEGVSRGLAAPRVGAGREAPR